MKECLSGIKDERRQSGHFLYKLIDVLVIGLSPATVFQAKSLTKSRFLMEVGAGIEVSKRF